MDPRLLHLIPASLPAGPCAHFQSKPPCLSCPASPVLIAAGAEVLEIVAASPVASGCEVGGLPVGEMHYCCLLAPQPI